MAKREQLEGRPVYVHMNPIFWDFPSNGIQPTWLRSDYLTNQADYPDLYHTTWTKNQRLSILRLMEEHVQDIIYHYCSTQTYDNSTSGPFGGATPTPHPWNGTSLQGVVSVYEIANEVTNGNGTVRELDTIPENFPYGWAIVNELVRPGSPYFDQATYDAYNPTGIRQYQDFYVYQAFKYAEEGVDTHCTGSANIKPKISLNAHFRTDLPINPGQENNNIWAQGTLDLINRVNFGRPTNNFLIEGVGIQSHLTVRSTTSSNITPTPFPTLPPLNTPTPVPTSSPSPTPTSIIPPPPPFKDSGAPTGLRSILEAFRSSFLEVRITEVDVGIEAKLIVTPTPSGPPISLASDYFPLQADYYASVVRQCLYDNTGEFDPICKEITAWVLYDNATSYKFCEFATLFRPPTINPACLTATPTFTPSPTPSATPTGTQSPTPTGTITPPTRTPTFTATSTPTGTLSPTPTFTPPPSALYGKPAQISVYKELNYAPTPYPSPTPTGTITPSATPSSPYPAPLAPTPYPTQNSYP